MPDISLAVEVVCVDVVYHPSDIFLEIATARLVFTVVGIKVHIAARLKEVKIQ